MYILRLGYLFRNAGRERGHNGCPEVCILQRCHRFNCKKPCSCGGALPKYRKYVLFPNRTSVHFYYYWKKNGPQQKKGFNVDSTYIHLKTFFFSLFHLTQVLRPVLDKKNYVNVSDVFLRWWSTDFILGHICFKDDGFSEQRLINVFIQASPPWFHLHQLSIRLTVLNDYQGGGRHGPWITWIWWPRLVVFTKTKDRLYSRLCS